MALESFQSGKRFLPVMVHYLMVLYPPPSTSPRCALTSLTPPPRREQQKTLALTQVEWEDTTPDSSPSFARNPTPTAPTPPSKTQKQRVLPVTRVEWDDTPEPTTEDVTIRQKTPTTSVASLHSSPRSTKQQRSGVRQQRTNQTKGATPTAPRSPEKEEIPRSRDDSKH